MDAHGRHLLKRNDLEHYLLTAVDWIKANRQTALSIAAISAGVIIFAVFVIVRLHTAQGRANDRLSMAQGRLYSGDIAGGVSGLDEIIQKYAGTAAASQARLLKADYLESQKNFTAAAEMARAVMADGKPKTIIPLAYMSLGNIQENAGDIKGAIATYTAFLDTYPDHFYAAKAYESLGRLHEFANEPGEAKSAYERLATMYPDTAWAQRARERLSFLSSTTAAQPVVQK